MCSKVQAQTRDVLTGVGFSVIVVPAPNSLVQVVVIEVKACVYEVASVDIAETTTPPLTQLPIYVPSTVVPQGTNPEPRDKKSVTLLVPVAGSMHTAACVILKSKNKKANDKSNIE